MGAIFVKIVILAGGSGTRLWPLSRDAFPKQFLKIDDEWSLLQKTILRFYQKEAPQDILIVTNPECLHLVKSQAKAIHPSLENRVVVEPVRKNTGPAILYAVKYLTDVEGVGLDEPILFTPSDQIIEPQEKFAVLVKEAEALAKNDVIVTFGIVPDKPETGYGYLEVALDEKAGIYTAVQFVEKPSFEVAEKYLEAGNYLWNSGMFAFNAKTLFREIANHTPELREAAEFSFEELQNQFGDVNTDLH